MDLLFKAFDIFNQAAKKMAIYVPQNGTDVINLLKKIGVLAMSLNSWITDNIGLNLKNVLAGIGKIAVNVMSLLLDIAKQLVDRM